MIWLVFSLMKSLYGIQNIVIITTQGRCHGSHNFVINSHWNLIKKNRGYHLIRFGLNFVKEDLSNERDKRKGEMRTGAIQVTIK
jgi:hypothetical protein